MVKPVILFLAKLDLNAIHTRLIIADPAFKLVKLTSVGNYLYAIFHDARGDDVPITLHIRNPHKGVARVIHDYTVCLLMGDIPLSLLGRGSVSTLVTGNDERVEIARPRPHKDLVAGGLRNLELRTRSVRYMVTSARRELLACSKQTLDKIDFAARLSIRRMLNHGGFCQVNGGESGINPRRIRTGNMQTRAVV